jgi:hypothetical protein
MTKELRRLPRRGIRTGEFDESALGFGVVRTLRDADQPLAVPHGPGPDGEIDGKSLCDDVRELVASIGEEHEIRAIFKAAKPVIGPELEGNISGDCLDFRRNLRLVADGLRHDAEHAEGLVLTAPFSALMDRRSHLGLAANGRRFACYLGWRGGFGFSAEQFHLRQYRLRAGLR